MWKFALFKEALSYSPIYLWIIDWVNLCWNQNTSKIIYLMLISTSLQVQVDPAEVSETVPCNIFLVPHSCPSSSPWNFDASELPTGLRLPPRRIAFHMLKNLSGKRKSLMNVHHALNLAKLEPKSISNSKQSNCWPPLSQTGVLFLTRIFRIIFSL